ncbi:MAG: YbfB/YjiJ family MFS transporter [Gammaproteobacteria bacterium]|nr:YbfB/YjiJ family MFS transporter [Gammaproteobacteria bacterium]
MNIAVRDPAHKPLLVAFAGALIIAASMGIGRFAYTPLLPGLIETLGWSVARAGDVASANFFGYLLGAMAAALLVHRPERHSGLLFGLIFSAMTTLACALTGSFVLWLILRFVSGFASAFAMILGTAVVVEVFKRQQRPQLISTHFAGLSVGIIASVLIIEIAKSLNYPVFAQWGVLGLVSVLMFAIAWVILAGLKSDVDTHATRSVRSFSPFSNMPLFRLIIAYGLMGFGYVVTATFIVAIARGIQTSAYLEPTTWIIVGLVGGPSLYVWQYFSNRFTVFLALRFAYAIQATGVVLAGVANTSAGVLLGGALLGGTFMAITSMGFIAARELAQGYGDKAIAWMTVSFGIGQLLGPAVAGRMADATGSFAAPSVLASALLLCGLFLIKSK